MGPSPDERLHLEPPDSNGPSFRSRLRSTSSISSIVQASIRRDLRDSDEHNEGQTGDTADSDTSTVRPAEARLPTKHSMGSSYRRPSFVSASPRPVATAAMPYPGPLTEYDREEAERAELSLLRDNDIVPPKRRRPSQEPLSTARGFLDRCLSRESSSTSAKNGTGLDASHNEGPSETSHLLARQSTSASDSSRDTTSKWEDAVLSGRIQTNWEREVKTIGKYSKSLILTFLLQYSLTTTSIFAVGHLGKNELGAVSLAGMTANITGYAIYQGLATSLDTLCAQAYGSGRKELVGLQVQRMVYFLWLVTIPIGIIWLSSTIILNAIIPQPRLAALAGTYLKITLLGAPGYAAFESGKRFVQAQGLFSATLWVLLICAPLNVLMSWLFVWKFQWGFIGAPIAVAITETLLPVLLALYVFLIDGRECWPGLTRRAFVNWGPMIRLALPGLLMLLSEFLAFELLTLASSYLGTTYLAAQAVLSTICSITFQIPFPISIAASTRIANLIGATLSEAAKTTAKVGLVAAFGVGLFNVVLLASFRDYIPRLFSSDPDVIELVARVLPLCAAFQLFDSTAAGVNGILRGLGQQSIGGWVNLFCYYAIAMPISMGTCFGLGWGLFGLWGGTAIALVLVTAIEGWFIYRTDWDVVVEQARERNMLP